MSTVSAAQKFDNLRTHTDKSQKSGKASGDSLKQVAEGFGNVLGGAAAVAAQVGMQVVQGAAGGMGGGPIGSIVSNTLGGVTGVGGSETQQQANLIQLQRRVNQENLYWQTCSNIEKANNDSKSNTVRAIKP